MKIKGLDNTDVPHCLECTKTKRVYTNPKCCKRCGSTDHIRSRKTNCPAHPEYVQKEEVEVVKKPRGRPKGSKKTCCNRCGATDHVNCSKKKCPLHPEYKPKRARVSSEYNLFVRRYLPEVNKVLGKDANFADAMKLTGLLWKSVKKLKSNEE